MSDLSWLNPTPHATAVYASQPLSPGATQHSLPSGRYSLLGPDLHRQDRTSFCLAHSFDHLVSAGEQAIRYREAELLCSLEIDHQLVPGRCLHRQIGRFLALEDAIDVASGAAALIEVVGPIGDQAAADGVETSVVDRGQSVPGRQRDNQIAMQSCRRAPGHDETVIRTLGERSDGVLDLCGIVDIDGAQLDAKRWRHGLA